jgi:ribosome recycling factor
LALTLNPQTEEGGIVKVPLPRISMETRQQTAKQLQKKAESCKQRIRKVRRKAMDVVKKGKDGKLAGISKDDAFAIAKELDTVTDQVMKLIKDLVDTKLESIMAV